MKSDALQKLIHRAVRICYVMEGKPWSQKQHSASKKHQEHSKHDDNDEKQTHHLLYIYVQNEPHIIVNQSPHHLFLMLKANPHGAVQISKVSSERINAFFLDLLDKRLDFGCNGLGVKAKVLVRLLAG